MVPIKEAEPRLEVEIRPESDDGPYIPASGRRRGYLVHLAIGRISIVGQFFELFAVVRGALDCQPTPVWRHCAPRFTRPSAQAPRPASACAEPRADASEGSIPFRHIEQLLSPSTLPAPPAAGRSRSSCLGFPPTRPDASVVPGGLRGPRIDQDRHSETTGGCSGHRVDLSRTQKAIRNPEDNRARDAQ